MFAAMFGYPMEYFWRMTPKDFWLMYDGIRRKQQGGSSARMTLGEYHELREKLRSKGVKV